MFQFVGGAPQRLVGSLFRGYVVRVGKNQLALRYGQRVPPQPAVRPVLRPIPVLKGINRSAGFQLFDSASGGIQVVWMYEVRIWLGQQALGGHAEGMLPRGIDPLEISVHTGDAQQVGRQREELVEFLLGTASFGYLDLQFSSSSLRQPRLAVRSLGQ